MSDFKSLEGGIPSDMTMLLRLIDSKFETMGAKMDGLQASLDTMTSLHKRFDARLDDHEGRLQGIEQQMEARKVVMKEYEALKDDVKAVKEWADKDRTTMENAKSWGGAIWAIAGSAITAILGWIIVGYVGSLHAAPPVDQQHTKTTIEQTVSAPANDPTR